MDRRDWLGVAIVALLSGAACSNGGAQVHTSPTPTAAPTAVSSATPTVEATPSAEGGPAVSCSYVPTPVSERLLLASTPGNGTVLLESLADPAHPTTLCTLSGGDFRFISPISIGYRTNSSPNDPIHGTTIIGTINLIDLKPVVWVEVQGDVLDFTWSASSFAYLLYSDVAGTGPVNQLWLVNGRSVPQPITPQIPVFGRDGSPDDQTVVRFSSDGHYLLMVDTFVAGAIPQSSDQADMQVYDVPDGHLIWVPPSALEVSGSKTGPYVTMAAWSHRSDLLYYRDNLGVHTWEPEGTPATFASGVPWRWPSLSPDDSVIAYELPVNGLTNIQVQGLDPGSPHAFPNEGRPILLSDVQMIEGHLDGAGGVFVRNLTTGAESPLTGIATVIDTLPH